MVSTLGVDNPFRYRGYIYDDETGFYYLQNRYYDPKLCRFISPDDITGASRGLDNILGSNVFAYCRNNPVMYIDPMGHGTITVILKKDFLRDTYTATFTGLVGAMGAIIGTVIPGYGNAIAGIIGGTIGWIIGGSLSRRYINYDVITRVYIPILRDRTITIY